MLFDPRLLPTAREPTVTVVHDPPLGAMGALAPIFGALALMIVAHLVAKALDRRGLISYRGLVFSAAIGNALMVVAEVFTPNQRASVMEVERSEEGQDEKGEPVEPPREPSL